MKITRNKIKIGRLKILKWGGKLNWKYGSIWFNKKELYSW